MEQVSLLYTDKYDKEQLSALVREHFENLGGIENIIPKNARVVIKPNVVAGEKPQKAVTTHPAVVAAVIDAVRERTDDITIAESPGGPLNSARLHSAFKSAGIADFDCKYVYDITEKEVSVPDGVKCKAFKVIKEIAEAEVLISVAKLKTHSMMAYTGAVKNLFGSIYGLEKAEYHFRYNNKEDFSEMIVDLCLSLKPTISFIDGIEGMEGNGPTGGKVKKANIFLAGLNPFAVDVVGSNLIGIDEELSGQLATSIRRGLTPGLEGIEIKGESFDKMRCEFALPDSLNNTVSFGIVKKLPPGIRKFLDIKLSPKPVVDFEQCIGCGKCAASCPKKTITIKEGKAHIHIGKCIRCYCCQELCPKAAVSVKSLGVYKL